MERGGRLFFFFFLFNAIKNWLLIGGLASRPWKTATDYKLEETRLLRRIQRRYAAAIKNKKGQIEKREAKKREKRTAEREWRMENGR